MGTGPGCPSRYSVPELLRGDRVTCLGTPLCPLPAFLLTNRNHTIPNSGGGRSPPSSPLLLSSGSFYPLLHHFCHHFCPTMWVRDIQGATGCCTPLHRRCRGWGQTPQPRQGGYGEMKKRLQLEAAELETGGEALELSLCSLN